VAGGAKTQLLKRVLEEHFELVEGGAVRARGYGVAGALQNPHEPDAQWSAKGQGRHKKEVVGYKVNGVTYSTGSAPYSGRWG
jgi:hypothetical protein